MAIHEFDEGLPRMRRTRAQYIAQAQRRLEIATDYAVTFRSSDEPELIEACEKAIRFANMWSQAILAMSVNPDSEV